MIVELKDTEKAAGLFKGWEETIILSCLQKIMGSIHVVDPEAPVSAMASAGCFAFYAGVPDEEIVRQKPEGITIMTPQNEEWAACIEACFPNAEKKTRYAIKKDTRFDLSRLQQMVLNLPDGYELQPIGEHLYEQCLKNPMTADFVSAFDSREHYLNLGRGVVILKDGVIVSGASSYTRYRDGIEIEVDTLEGERRKGLAQAACSALILRCLEEGLYPSWDAQNMASVHLAETLGYELDHAYTVYEISS